MIIKAAKDRGIDRILVTNPQYPAISMSTDDMAEDAWLFGVMLQITVDQNIAAW